MGRKRPYTEIGIKRVPCLRCGVPSTQQWQVCSLGNKWFGICTNCDIKLNTYVLWFFGIKDSLEIINKYANKVRKCQKI